MKYQLLMNTMIKSICSIAMLLISFSAVFSQAILPTAFNFSDATPEGWSESLGGSNTRYTNGFVGQACRLDQTSDYVLIEFAEEPGALTYYIKGQNQGATWQGTFTVEESPDGSVYTPLHPFVNGDLPFSSFTMYTDQPQITTRYIRFYFTNKVSGHNVALDEVSLATPVAGGEQEINVTDGSGNVPSGLLYSMGNDASQDFVIENLGSADALEISAITISGEHADQFSLGTIPTSINPGSASTISLAFNPTGDGSRFCTINIESNDASETTYTIDIYAISGTLATEPTVQAAGVSFSNVYAWDFKTTLDAGTSNAEDFLVLRKKNSAVSELPVDGQTYRKGSWIGDAQVVYNGEAALFDGRGIESGATYHFAVFAYNGPEGFENYNTVSPVTGSQAAPAPSIGGYYSSVDVASPNYVTQLIAVMNPSNYFQIFYSNYLSTLIDNFYVRDTIIGNESLNAVACQYSGTLYTYPGGFQWWSGSGDPSLSREHSYPQSWMPTYFDTGFDDSPEVSDLHNLFPVLQEECNAVRSNYPYGEVVTANSTYLECSYGENANGQDCYEMRDEFKGNAARGIMYHAVKNHTSSNDFSLPEQISLIIPYGQPEYVLKQWHFQDLPDSWEITRNEYIQFEQHNRNAFIDNVQYPCYIRLSNMTKFVPQFIYNGTTLTCTDQALNYQWYFEGNEIDGATSSTYNWTEPGNYSVEIQQFDECPVMTSSQVLVTSEIVNSFIPEMEMNVFPNPSNGLFNLNVASNGAMQAEWVITDATGRTVHTGNLFVMLGQNRVPMNVQLSSGVYSIELRTEKSRHTTKLIVE
jgi:hypothetical protein